jgi:hypothetical protein
MRGSVSEGRNIITGGNGTRQFGQIVALNSTVRCKKKGLEIEWQGVPHGRAAAISAAGRCCSESRSTKLASLVSCCSGEAVKATWPSSITLLLTPPVLTYIRGHGAAGRSWTKHHLPIGISKKKKFTALESYEKHSCGQVPASRRVAFCSSLLQKCRNLRLSVCRVKCAQRLDERNRGCSQNVKCINLLFSCHSPGAFQAQPVAIIVWPYTLT